MELSRKDAYLVLRTAYKTGLLQKMMQKPPAPKEHIPGTSLMDAPPQDMDVALLENMGQFLAELLYEARKEGKE